MSTTTLLPDWRWARTRRRDTHSHRIVSDASGTTILHCARRGAAGVCPHWPRRAAGQGGQLDDAPRARLDVPGVAALADRPRRRADGGPLRRTWLGPVRPAVPVARI